VEKFVAVAERKDGADSVPIAIKLFGGAAIDYQNKYGAEDRTFAMVAVKARRHAKHNQRAIFRNELTLEEVLESRKMFGPSPACNAVLRHAEQPRRYLFQSNSPDARD
jgi:acetyl-CoA acetyltransferase